MKNALILLSCIVALHSCSKNNTGSTTSVNSAVDTVIVYDDSMTFRFIQNRAMPVQCMIDKNIAISLFTMRLTASDLNPLSLAIGNARGPLNGLGQYNVHPADSFDFVTSSSNSFTESFNGGEDFTVDSAFVTVDSAYNRTVTGSFEMYVHNTARSKKITGTISCHNATIN